ncbi:MAG TPA: hypothetical protein VGY91_08775 [Chthoniobacterales bacterium]|nr:hypothetical protein [Chthoniobacterales bacterium]
MNFAIPYTVGLDRRPSVRQCLFADTPDVRVAHFSMRSRIENKKNRVTGLLFKINIAPALTFSVQTSHFHNAVHRFTLVLCMTPVCDLSPKFKESDIFIHTVVG